MVRVLCIVTEILGNKTFNTRLLASLALIPDVQVEVIRFTSDDYRKYPTARLYRLSNTVESQKVFLSKLNDVGIPPHDILLVNGLWLAMEVIPKVGHNRIAVATDTTPILIRNQKLRTTNSVVQRIGSQVTGAYHDWQTRRIVPKTRFFLPRSSWCGNSFVSDYGADPSQIRITLSPQPAAKGRAHRDTDGPFRLLFVGNDFARKGGMMLLEAFRTQLGEKCKLTIVSNDQALAGLTLPEGVKWVAGLRSSEEVAAQYLQHDLLLYPSNFDQFSHVIAEAAMAGVPSITSDIGGVKDLVIHDDTGLVLPVGASSAEWANAILTLATDKGRYQRFADATFQFADSRLRIDHFHRLIADVIEVLR